MSDDVQEPRSSAINFDRVIGTLTHQLLADNLEAGRDLSPTALVALLLPQTTELVTHTRVPGRRQAAITRITSLVSHYIQRLAPPPFVDYLGAEQVLGEGRVDLTYQHPTLGIFFDELKTWKSPRLMADDATTAQLARFVRGGGPHGSAWAGIRLLPISALADATLHRPDGTVSPLASTHLSPAALRAQQRALIEAGGDLAALPQGSAA